MRCLEGEPEGFGIWHPSHAGPAAPYWPASLGRALAPLQACPALGWCESLMDSYESNRLGCLLGTSGRWLTSGRSRAAPGA